MEKKRPNVRFESADFCKTPRKLHNQYSSHQTEKIERVKKKAFVSLCKRFPRLYDENSKIKHRISDYYYFDLRMMSFYLLLLLCCCVISPLNAINPSNILQRQTATFLTPKESAFEASPYSNNYEILIADTSDALTLPCWSDLSHCDRNMRLEFSWIIRQPNKTSTSIQHEGGRGDLGHDFDLGRGTDLLKGRYPYVKIVYVHGVLSISIGRNTDYNRNVENNQNTIDTPTNSLLHKTTWTLSATGFTPGLWYQIKLQFMPAEGLSLFVNGVQRGHIKVPQMQLLLKNALFASSPHHQNKQKQSSVTQNGEHLLTHEHHYLLAHQAQRQHNQIHRSQHQSTINQRTAGRVSTTAGSSRFNSFQASMAARGDDGGAGTRVGHGGPQEGTGSWSSHHDIQVIGSADSARHPVTFTAVDGGTSDGAVRVRTTRSPPIIDSRGNVVRGRSGEIPAHPRNALRKTQNTYRISFINNGFIRYTSRDAKILADDFEIFLDFDTKVKNGFLFYVGRDMENMFLKLEEGNVILYINTEFGKQQNRLEIIYPPGYEIVPGAKHQIIVKKTSNKIMLSVDNQYVQQKEMSKNFSPLTVSPDGAATSSEEFYFDFGGTNQVILDRALTRPEYFNGTFYEIIIMKETADATKTKFYPVDMLIRREPDVQVFGTLRYLSRQDINVPAILDVGSNTNSNPGTFDNQNNAAVSFSFNEVHREGGAYLTLSSNFLESVRRQDTANQNRVPQQTYTNYRKISMKLMTNEPRGIVLYDDSSIPVCIEIFSHRLYLLYAVDGGLTPYRTELYVLPLSQPVSLKYELILNHGITVQVGEQNPVTFPLPTMASSNVVYGDITIGGRNPRAKSNLPTLSTNSFIGCIQDLTINDGMSTAPKFSESPMLNSDENSIKIYRVDRCEAPKVRCRRTACYNNGLCQEGYNRTYCDCGRTPYSGQRCEKDAPTLNLEGDQVVRIILPSNFTSTITEIALRFKTTHNRDSVVLYADCSSADNLKIYLEGGRVKVNYVNAGQTNSVTSRNSYVDGNWHQVDFRKDGQNVKVQIDDEVYRNADIYGTEMQYASVARPMTIETIQVGGIDTYPQSAYFQGSIQHLMVNGLPFINADGRAPIPSSRVITQPVVDNSVDKRHHYKIFNMDGNYYYKYTDDKQGFQYSNNIVRVQTRTNRPDMGILSISSPNSPVRMNLEAEGGRPKLLISYEGRDVPLYSDIRIDDGNWHDLIVARDGQSITLKVDGSKQSHYIPGGNMIPSIYQILVGTSDSTLQQQQQQQNPYYGGRSAGHFIGQLKNPQCDGIDLSTEWVKVWAPPPPPPPPPRPPAAPHYNQYPQPPMKSMTYAPPPPPQKAAPLPPPPPQYPVYQPKYYAPPTRPPPPPPPPPTYSYPKVIYQPPPPPPPKYYPQPPPMTRPPLPPPPPPQTKAPPAPSRPCLIALDGKTYAKVVHPANVQSNLVGNRDLELHFRSDDRNSRDGRTAILSSTDGTSGSGDRESQSNALLYLDNADDGALKLIYRFKDQNGRIVDKILSVGNGLNDNRWHKVRINQRGHGLELILDDRERSTNYDDVPGFKPLQISESYLGYDNTDAFTDENVAPFKGEIRDYRQDNSDILCDWANNRRSPYTVYYPIRIASVPDLSFNGYQFMKVIFPHPKPNFTRNEFSMKFNTKNENGVVFATISCDDTDGNSTYLVGLLEDGVLKIIGRDGEQYKDILIGSELNDGKWHNLKVVHNGNDVTVYLDDYPHITSQLFDRAGAGATLCLDEAHFGGFETRIPEYAYLPGLSGYMRDIRINSRDFFRMHHGLIDRGGHLIYYPLNINRVSPSPIPPPTEPPLPPIPITEWVPPPPPPTAPPIIGEPPVIAGTGGIVQNTYDVIRPVKSHLMGGALGPVLAAIAALFPLLAGLLWACYKCKPGMCVGPWGRKGAGGAVHDYRPIPMVSQGVMDVVDQQQRGGMYSQVQRHRRREEEEFMIKEGGSGGTTAGMSTAIGTGGTQGRTTTSTLMSETFDSSNAARSRDQHEASSSVQALSRAIDREPRVLATQTAHTSATQPARVEKETEEYTRVVRYGRDAPRGPGYWGGPAPFIGPSTREEPYRPPSRTGYDYQLQSMNTLNRNTREERLDPRYKETTRGLDQEASRYEEYRSDGGSPPYFIETPRAATLNMRAPPGESSHNLLGGGPIGLRGSTPLGLTPTSPLMAIESLIVTPDNVSVITGSDTVPPQIWNLETGQISKILEGEEGSSDLYLAGPNNRTLVGLALTEPITSPNHIPKKKLTTWDIDSGTKTMTYGKDIFTALTLLNDRRTGVLTSFDEGIKSGNNEVNVTLMDVLNGGVVDKRLSYTPTFGLGNVRSFLCKSADDNFILAGFFDPIGSVNEPTLGGTCNIIIVDLGEIKRGNTDSKAFSCTVTSPDCVCVLNPDRTATGSPRGEITIWNLNTGKKQSQLRESSSGSSNSLAHLGPVLALISSYDGRYLVSASKDTTIKSWQDLGNREYVHKLTFHGHKSDVTCLDLSRDGKLLASGSTDKMIRLWNFEDGSHLCSFETSTEILNIRISRDNRTIVAIGQRDGIKKLIILKVLP